MEPLAQPGEVVGGRYRIVRLIGRGSMADVFEAIDFAGDDGASSGVALKILRGAVARDREAVERLRREAQAQQRIRHPNVAAVHGGGVTSRGEAYLVVELLRGRSLRSVLKSSGPIPPHHAASYAWQALQGLATAHAAGIVHRDLKPANLMLEASAGPVERVVLIDFGFASLEGQARLTRQGHVVGSLAYLAPERLSGAPGDARSDLYAVGVILYELLVGKRPFSADDDAELIHLLLDALPEPPRAVAPDVGIPEALERVVMSALSKAPDLRAADAATMARELEDAMADYQG